MYSWVYDAIVCLRSYGSNITIIIMVIGFYSRTLRRRDEDHTHQLLRTKLLITNQTIFQSRKL